MINLRFDKDLHAKIVFYRVRRQDFYRTLIFGKINYDCGS
jgi:hypothetical protein